MPCVCSSCLQHFRTLGVAKSPASKEAIHKAYRAAAKLWHPDRFERNQQKRLEAEERFKQIHFAYQELCAHHENPVRTAREVQHVTPVRKRRMPTIFFGDDAPGCYAGPNFPPEVSKWIEATRLDSTERPVGFIDLARGRSGIVRYIVLTDHKLYIRDSTDILAVIWYSDVGEVTLTELSHGKLQGTWQRIAEKIAGKPQQYALRIGQLNGKLFRELVEQPDDRVKKVIYNFLRQMKSESQS